MAPRHRRRWVAAALVAGLWLVLIVVTESLAGSIILLLLLAALAAAAVVAGRLLGIDSAHPAVRRLRSRPWRNGQDVWQVALRHLPETFLIAPDRSLLASDVVELRMSPADLGSLAESIDLELVSSSASEAYRAQIAEHRARLAGTAEPRVVLVSDPGLAPGRYRLKARAGDQPATWDPGAWEPAGGVPAGEPAGAARAADAGAAGARAAEARAAQAAVAGASITRAEPMRPVDAAQDELTVPEAAAVPALRLVTGGVVAQTRTSGARAGRGGDAELRLPNVPTVSRVHAEFTFAEGRWWVTNRGRNGLLLNGVPLDGRRPLAGGDVIRWGGQPDALTSRVEIGRPAERAAAPLR